MDPVAPQRAPSPRFAAAVALALVLFAIPAVAQNAPSEYEVKAAFLLNFTKFIEWPSSPSTPETPFTICIFGEDPFGPILPQIVQGEQVAQRPIAVRRLRQSAAGCDVLFVSKSERSAAALLSALPRGTLTIGESENFLRDGGVISFVLENRRVRFDVNEPAAARNGLKISSRLLNVARTVERHR
jgi:hypothetical protein